MRTIKVPGSPGCVSCSRRPAHTKLKNIYKIYEKPQNRTVYIGLQPGKKGEEFLENTELLLGKCRIWIQIRMTEQ